MYRDPVHDFGILRFDPKAIKYLTLTPLELRPEFARNVHLSCAKVHTDDWKALAKKSASSATMLARS